MASRDSRKTMKKICTLKTFTMVTNGCKKLLKVQPKKIDHKMMFCGYLRAIFEHGLVGFFQSFYPSKWAGWLKLQSCAALGYGRPELAECVKMPPYVTAVSQLQLVLVLKPLCTSPFFFLFLYQIHQSMHVGNRVNLRIAKAKSNHFQRVCFGYQLTGFMQHRIPMHR